MHYKYKPSGVCSVRIDFDLEDGVLHNVVYTGGCNGNLQAIGILLEGMNANEAANKLAGIRCGWKPTSCPDQLSQALRKILADS